MEKEIKKKAEHVKKSSKRIEWLIEIWKNPMDYAKEIVRLRALFDNIKDIDNKKAGNIGECLIIIDGILETDIQGRWEQKPTFYFLRSIFDKFGHKFYTGRFEGSLTSNCYKLHKAIYDFFSQYKHI